MNKKNTNNGLNAIYTMVSLNMYIDAIQIKCWRKNIFKNEMCIL